MIIFEDQQFTLPECNMTAYGPIPWTSAKVVGTVEVSDSEGSIVSISIITPDVPFAVKANTKQIIVFDGRALNYVEHPVWTFTVRATTMGGDTANATITVNLTDVLSNNVLKHSGAVLKFDGAWVNIREQLS